MDDSTSPPPASPAVAHWERLYRSVAANLPWEVDRTPPEFAQWAELITPGAAVLDLGCGRGQHAIAMAQRGFEVTGIDFSRAAIEAARRRAARKGARNVRFEVADILRFRPVQEFEFVYDYSVFHHVREADRQAYRDTVTRAVRDRGHFALVCYAETDPVVSLDGRRARTGKLGNVIYHPTRGELARLFGRDFSVRAYQLTTLGPKAEHLAHHVIFSRTRQAGRVEQATSRSHQATSASPLQRGSR